MNNDLCSVISKIFAYKPNITKMEKGRLTPILRALHWGNRIQWHHIYQQKKAVVEVDRKRILREPWTCLYLVSACWKASMRPCPEHSLPIWRYSDSYRKQTTSWTWYIAECHQHKSDKTFDDVEQSRQEGMCTLNITTGQERIPEVHQTQEHEKQSSHHLLAQTVYDQKDMIETIAIQFQWFQSDWTVARGGYHDRLYQIQPKDREALGELNYVDQLPWLCHCGL